MSISGPAVALSATGRLLALGPPGPPGLQGLTGPQGPPGPAGITGVADSRVYLNNATSPPGSPVTLALYAATPTYYVIDPTGGPVAVQLPTGAPSGSTVALKLAVGKAVSGTNYVKCLAPGSGSVEVPLGASNGSATVLTPGTSALQFLLNNANFQGTGLMLETDGSNNWEICAR